MKKKILALFCLSLGSLGCSLSPASQSVSSSHESLSSSKTQNTLFSSDAPVPSSTVSSSSSATEHSSSSLATSSRESSASAPSSSTLTQSQVTYEEFFDYSKFGTITIEGSEEAFSFISEYQSDRYGIYNDFYVPVDVTIHYNDCYYHYDEVGLRMKGNTSRKKFFERGSFFDMPHFKLSFKATFDDEVYNDSALRSFKHDWSNDVSGRKARKDRNFAGLEKIDLKRVPRNIQGEDACVLREAYVYDAFREQGLEAPRVTFGKVCLDFDGTTTEGDYEFIEPIDKEFLKKRYGKAGAQGDLYKCVYNKMGKANFTRDNAIDRSTLQPIKNGKIGVEDNYRGYVPSYQKKTNDSAMQESDFTSMSNFIAKLWQAVYDNAGKEALESVIDVEQFLKFSAVSFLLGNFDDQRYDYNNFYLYFRPEDDKAIILPYDWDWCLGHDLGHHLASLDPLDSWTLDGDTNSNLYLATLIDNESVSYDLSDYQQRYLDHIEKVKDEVLNPQKYVDFAAIYGLDDTVETETVLSYMQEKSTHTS